ncbi:hypothetical protein I5677_02625 [Mobilitalea sibirica]|uniref:Type 4 fimbrial biogenesis protein PilX N-terminal domain-containing protein n=1 Tax=Mobilitalea sibirica TaxID=1462919 RepID=A0A8J7HBB1_9FIRM|nr:hypothetical protein [Mobilitalea sibirica]MBH1939787.1 hypothetical protein [Mobilitalea sibirica]
MRKQGFKLNNEGSTLLTVIICLAFIGILGSMMLSVTMTNLQMKIVESKSKANFYKAEIAIEEIRTGIQEVTIEKIREVYEQVVLVDYASYVNLSQNDRNAVMQDMVAARVIKSFGDTGSMTDSQILSASSVPPVLESFSDYLSITGGLSLNIDSLYSLISGTERSVVIKDIRVEYEKDDYKTSITSDIKIVIPEFTFEDGTEIITYSMEDRPFRDYVLVADGGISSVNNSNQTIINGSIYAGKDGITIHSNRTRGHSVEIYGDNIVTKGDIRVVDTAHLKIGDISSVDKPILWADNLVTVTTHDYNPASTLPTSMEINAISIIKDDLALEGKNSDVSFPSGAYIGYTGSFTSEGSAIMINGSGSSMDLSGLNSLILAGRANVSVEDKENNKDSDILTGESLAFKSNQRIYLIPGRHIPLILHNPVTKADVDAYGLPNVDFTDSDIPFMNYVAASKPYKIAAMQAGTGAGASTLRYYYLNFASGKQADDYTRLFADSPLLDSMNPFTLGNVRIPTVDKIQSVGNLMTYDSTDLVKLTSGLSEDHTTYPDDTTLDQHIKGINLTNPIYTNSGLPPVTVGDLPELYAKMNKFLTLDEAGSYDSDLIFDYFIKAGSVNQIIANAANWNSTLFEYQVGNYNYINSDPDKQTFLMVEGDVTITDSSIMKGILVATGDIIVSENATIHGMVISTGETGTGDGNIDVQTNVEVIGRLVAAGEIRLSSSCRLTADEALIETYLKPIFDTEGEILNKFFSNMKVKFNYSETLPADNLVDLSNMIYYENWRKN